MGESGRTVRGGHPILIIILFPGFSRIDVVKLYEGEDMKEYRKRPDCGLDIPLDAKVCPYWAKKFKDKKRKDR